MILSRKVGMAATAFLALTACNDPLDFDLRGQLGAFSTAPAARKATAPRPTPDARGVISYPNYQVVVAKRGDTLNSVASRIGLPATELASYNGIATDAPLRDGEIIALPSRVSEPSEATGAILAPGAGVDVTTLAGQAIDNAPETPPNTDTQVAALEPLAPAQGNEPIRHRVERGETAYTIARLYRVPVRSLADWNGLGSDYSVREGQFLLIPVAQAAPVEVEDTTQSAAVTAPGEGTETPTPPSASRPLPVDETAEAPQAPPPAPEIGNTATASADAAAMMRPVDGSVIREYTKGRNDGIDIKGAPGGPVSAAADGSVAAITKSAEGVPILVVRHPNNVLTVYANLAKTSVKKGESVKRGDTIGTLRDGDQSFVHFEVREGFDSVDPNNYLQ